MLAYVFWHWPGPDVARAEYEQYQRAFHAALAQAAPAGFLESRTFGCDGSASWLGGSPAYADWYLIDTSAALDALNVAAVSGVCEQPHAQVAGAMAAGAGSLLALRTAGDRVARPDPGAVHYATWLTKPREMSYATFYAATDTLPEADQRTLWRRTMVLGPTPEFGLLSRSRPEVPAALQPTVLALTAV